MAEVRTDLVHQRLASDNTVGVECSVFSSENDYVRHSKRFFNLLSDVKCLSFSLLASFFNFCLNNVCALTPFLFRHDYMIS